MNILAFGASSSSKSINRTFAKWAVSQIDQAEAITPDLNDYEMPIYSVDKEAATGIPEKAEEFKKLIESADGIIISLAEHNGSYSAAFKNIMDWISRMPSKLWGEKKMLLLSTSPGGRGGQNVLNTAAGGYPYMGAEVITTFAMPSYHANFSEAEGITDAGLRTEFEKALSLFTTALD